MDAIAMGEPPRVRARSSMWLALAAIWLLSPGALSLPGREGPSTVDALDPIGIFKASSRVLVCVILGVRLLLHRSDARTRAAIRQLWPFGCFVTWAVSSVAWSPLTAVSAGQALGLVALFLLAVTVASEWRSAEDTSRVAFHITVAALTLSAAVFVAHAIDPEISGLSDTSIEEGSAGLMHRGAAGAMAGVGLIVVVSTWLLWRWRWSRWLVSPASVLFVALLIAAVSRAALTLAVLLTLTALVVFARRARLVAAALAVCLVALTYPLVDRGLDGALGAAARVGEYVARGQTAGEFQSLTGRTELWEAIWASIRESPLIGHGYFVTSSQGEIDVWEGPAIRTAHNVILQVLVSTGVVGLALFLCGLALPIAACSARLRSQPSDRRTGGLLALLGLWFAGSGLLSDSFIGQVHLESVAFYAAAGIGVGALAAGGTGDRAALP